MVIRTNQGRSCYRTAGTALDQSEFAHRITVRVMARWGWQSRELNDLTRRKQIPSFLGKA